MFLDQHNQWLPPPGEPPRRRGGGRVLAWLLILNAVLWLLAPIGGATLLQPLLAWLRG